VPHATPEQGPRLDGTPGEPPVLLTALALERVRRVDGDQIAVYEILYDTRASRNWRSYAYTPVFVWALASSHANTSDRL